MLTKSKKILTIALTAVAITSFAATGDAFAKGGGGGGKGGHGHYFYGGGYGYSTIVVVDSCYRWIRGFRVFVCQ